MKQGQPTVNVVIVSIHINWQDQLFKLLRTYQARLPEDADVVEEVQGLFLLITVGEVRGVREYSAFIEVRWDSTNDEISLEFRRKTALSLLAGAHQRGVEGGVSGDKIGRFAVSEHDLYLLGCWIVVLGVPATVVAEQMKSEVIEVGGGVTGVCQVVQDFGASIWCWLDLGSAGFRFSPWV